MGQGLSLDLMQDSYIGYAARSVGNDVNMRALIVHINNKTKSDSSHWISINLLTPLLNNFIIFTPFTH